VITGKHAERFIDLIRTDVNSIRTLPDELRLGAIGAYQQSMRLVFIATTVAAACAFLSILRIPEHHLPGRK